MAATRTALRSTPLLIHQAPVAGIFYEHPKRLATGGVRVEIGYDTSHAPESGLQPVKQKVLIQTPRLRRVTPVYSEKFGKKWSCLSSLGGWNEDGTDAKALHDWVRDMDERTKGMCKERCLDWFRKQLQDHQYEEYYTSSVKYTPERNDYPPSLKASLPFRWVFVASLLFYSFRRSDKKLSTRFTCPGCRYDKPEVSLLRRPRQGVCAPCAPARAEPPSPHSTACAGRPGRSPPCRL